MQLHVGVYGLLSLGGAGKAMNSQASTLNPLARDFRQVSRQMLTFCGFGILIPSHSSQRIALIRFIRCCGLWQVVWVRVRLSSY